RRYTSTSEFGGGPRNWRYCFHSRTLSVTSRPSFVQKACTAVAILVWAGALFMYSVMFLFGFLTLAMYALALFSCAVAGMKLCFVITGPPAIPAGVKPLAGTWPAWAMYFT